MTPATSSVSPRMTPLRPSESNGRAPAFCGPPLTQPVSPRWKSVQHLGQPTEMVSAPRCSGLTWRQLGRHKKPVVFLDTAGYWQPFRALLDRIVDEGFAQDRVRRMYAFVTAPEEVLPKARAMLKS